MEEKVKVNLVNLCQWQKMQVNLACPLTALQRKQQEKWELVLKEWIVLSKI